ncbi:E3 ubiquitin-protein ligase TRIM7-like [Paroedura picta]|uniref:E3 ubiquitin-protein ligase TRIM7-like n=1 Tax=Paroedura picta TaxID=143630 RepID=UPI00405774E6
MAASSLVKEFCEEVTCSVCLEYFKEPVILDCGHNFCQACLTKCLAKTDKGTSCPQCRELVQQKNFRPNRQLVTLVELVKKLKMGKGIEGERGECPKHLEPLKLFCFTDQAPICVVCDRSMGHQDHRVLPMEEAFLEHKKEIQAQLRYLMSERERFKRDRKVKTLSNQRFLMQLESEKQKTKSAFQKMRDFLERQERHRLSQLEKMKREVEKANKENHARFLKEISDLSRLITELERKSQQPETAFVQDPKTTLSSHEKNPERQLVELPPTLGHNFRIYSEQTPELQKILKECEESLAKALAETLTKVSLTLDPKTAHPNLILPLNLKSVTGKRNAQSLPNNPERFDSLWSVLAREQFTSGRHWWEVDIGNEQSLWAVGVARESVKRKGYINRNPDEGFWILQTEQKQDGFKCYWQLCALTSSQSVAVPGSIPIKIRVHLDYEAGLVEFFSAPGNDRLFAFPSTSFSGEALCPYFHTGIGNLLKC